MTTLGKSDQSVDRLDHTADVVAWGLLVILFCSVAFALGFGFGGWLAPTTVEKPWLYEYQGLVGAVVTLVAAVVAWLAVQRQISAQRAISEAEYNEAKYFTISSLDDYLRTINLVWRELEREPSDENNEKRNIFISRQMAKARACSSSVKQQLQIAVSKIDYASNFLRISDRYKTNDIIEFAATSNDQISLLFEDEIEFQAEDSNEYDDPVLLAKLRIITQFSHLKKACAEFDPSLEKIFIGRRTVAVNWDQTWQHLERFTEQFPNIP